jgi:hypothetical protein
VRRWQLYLQHLFVNGRFAFDDRAFGAVWVLAGGFLRLDDRDKTCEENECE